MSRPHSWLNTPIMTANEMYPTVASDAATERADSVGNKSPYPSVVKVTTEKYRQLGASLTMSCVRPSIIPNMRNARRIRE